MKESKTVNRGDLFLGVMAGGAGLVGTGAAAAPSTLPAGPCERGDVDVLAVLPDVRPGVQSSVEGLTVGPDGNIYVPSFGFNTQGAHRQRRALRDLAEGRHCQAGHPRVASGNGRDGEGLLIPVRRDVSARRASVGKPPREEPASGGG